jgi:hypothetical protein
MHLLRNVIATRYQIDDVHYDGDVSRNFHSFVNNESYKDNNDDCTTNNENNKNYCGGNNDDNDNSNNDNSSRNNSNNDNINNNQTPSISSWHVHYGLAYEMMNTVFKEFSPLKMELSLKLICDAISCVISSEVVDILNKREQQSKIGYSSFKLSILNDAISLESVDTNIKDDKTENCDDDNYHRNRYEQPKDQDTEKSYNILEPLIKILIKVSQTVGISISSILDITVSATDNIYPQNPDGVSKIQNKCVSLNPQNDLSGISDPFSFHTTIINACHNINSGLLASAIVVLTIKLDFYSQEVANWLVPRYVYSFTSSLLADSYFSWRIIFFNRYVVIP